VPEQLHLVQAEVFPQRLHVTDLTIATIGGAVRRTAGLASAAQVQHDELPVRVKTTEIAEVDAGLHSAR
jgi:hypothetical protein